MYNFFSRIVVRTPSYTFNSYEEVNESELLEDDFFKASLYFASVEFYNELKKKDFNLEKLNARERNSLKKYWNRACFRPTPFGTFSSVATSMWTKENHGIRFLPDSLNVHVNLDYSSSLELTEKLLTKDGAEFVFYTTNQSIYKVSRYFRFFRYDLKYPKNNRVFSLISVEQNKLVNQIILFCKTGKTINQIIQFIEKKFGSSSTQIEPFVSQLIEQQIILPESGGNITGSNSLDALVEMLISKEVSSYDITEIDDILKTIHNTKVFKSLDVVIDAADRLHRMLDEVKEKRNQFYAVTDRSIPTGGINEEYQNVILDGIYCLNKLAIQHESDSLRKFKEKFIRKFEGQKVQLLLALDPELGVGYEGNANIYDDDWLLKHIDSAGSKNIYGREVQWSFAHSFLLNKMVSKQGETSSYILEIHEQELKELDEIENNLQFPPSISVMFRLNDKSVYLENVGGVSATTIISRFTPANKEIFDLAKEIAQKEQEVNDKVVFAEIAHIGDLYLANIDRRMHIRNNEIPIMVSSTLPLNHQIALSDLYVSINSANQIIVTSLSKNMVIIPRLSTAVNYTKSEFPTFRFLCDLQGQNLKNNFSLDLAKFFPGLKFYPRVVYKSAILFLATWNLKSADFLVCKQKEENDWFGCFSLIAEDLNLPTYFTLIYHDNYLVFDRRSKPDVELFLVTIEKYDHLCLQEFLFDVTATTESHKKGLEKPLIAQYVSSLYRQTAAYEYENVQQEIIKSSVSKKEGALKVNDWLYFKIYCHPVSSNELLINIILPLVNKLLKKKLIRKWFFVRYRDEDYHLRFRVEVPKVHLNETKLLISKRLDDGVACKLIARYFADNYLQELERYPLSLVQEIESVFFESSYLVLCYLKQYANANVEVFFTPLFDFILFTVDDVLSAFKLKDIDKASLMDELFNAFYFEQNGEKKVRKELEKKYKEIRIHLDLCDLNRNQVDCLYSTRRSLFCMSLTKLYDETRDLSHERIRKLICDLIHMHLNRLFLDNARKYELVVYYILYRHFSSLQFKNSHIPD